jgi:predicted nucleotidyltransferase
MNGNLEIPKERLTEFCERHHIARLSVSGSALRSDFGTNSDVDVLVEFEPGHLPGLAFFRMQDELSRILGCPVDLNTPGFLCPCFRDKVQADAEVQYAVS